MKNYFMVLLSIMAFGIMLTPTTSASPNHQIEDPQPIEAMYLPEMDKISELSLENIADTAEFTRVLETNYTPNTLAIAEVSVAPAVKSADYRVTVYSQEIVEHPDYANIYRTGKLIYAHNSSNLFDNLSSRTIGSTFTISENGVITTYRISDIKVFEKNPTNGLLQLDGSGNYMGLLKDSAFYHSVALMTCTGTSYGNGDASHRLVVFADAM